MTLRDTALAAYQHKQERDARQQAEQVEKIRAINLESLRRAVKPFDIEIPNEPTHHLEWEDDRPSWTVDSLRFTVGIAGGVPQAWAAIMCDRCEDDVASRMVTDWADLGKFLASYPERNLCNSCANHDR